MADKHSFPCTNSTQNHHTSKPISSFLGSPRFFNGILARSLSDSETMLISPNSILDSKQTFNLGNPFGYDRKKSSNPIIPTGKNKPKLESESIGLALIDSTQTKSEFPPSKDYILFSAKLKVEIPCSVEGKHLNANKDFGEKLSYTEMESSEDYTCVISHGPNPKTTHIFDNCIVESCCGVRKLGELMIRENCCNSDVPAECKDTYMYREERGFCSHVCCCEGQESGNEESITG